LEREAVDQSEGSVVMSGTDSGDAPRNTRDTITGGELRRLLALRARLRQDIVGQSRATQRDVLCAMEEARQLRQLGKASQWTPPAMAPDELIREIKWRLDVASVPELDAAAAVLERAARRRPPGPPRRGRPSRSERPST
jgi:hypothetical protein